uniref:Accessory gland protein Acp29AB-like n=1 Tax=Drosophila rhopaloa TaxID=1041015 RepID=A0A6P4EN70_DRORH
MEYTVFLLLLSISFGCSCSISTSFLEDEQLSQCGQYCFSAVQTCLSQLENTLKRVELCEAAGPSDILGRIAQLEEIGRNTQAELLQLKQQMSPAPPGNTLSTEIGEKIKRNFQKLGSKLFYIESTDRKTWHGALQRCYDLGGHLASFQSQEDIDAIDGKLKEYSGYWIDVTDQYKEGAFVSVSTGLNATFFKWGPDEPNNAGDGEHCVELHTFEGAPVMNDILCSHRKFFICESSLI